MTGSDSPLSAAGYYDRISGQYGAELEARAAYVEAVDARVIGHVRDHAVETVLDVGCGPGTRLRRLVEATGVRAVGIDVSQRMVEAARLAGVDAYRADISDPGQLGVLPLRRFDAALALWNVLGHLPGQAARQAALSNISDLVRAGGWLIMDVNNRYNAAAYGWSRVARNVMRDRLGRPGSGDFLTTRTVDGAQVSVTTHLFAPDEVVEDCRRAGLIPGSVVFLDYDDGALAAHRWRGQIYLVARVAGR